MLPYLAVSRLAVARRVPAAELWRWLSWRVFELPIDPRQDVANEAWLLFRLNDAPVRTQADGDFNVLAIIDVATGLILGMAFIDSLAREPSEFESLELSASAESECGRRPGCLIIDSEMKMTQLVAVADALGIEIVPGSGSDLGPLTQEAREGFAAHVSGDRTQ